MITSSLENQKFIFQHEVLRARLDIRDFFLKTTVKNVYENIGQVLSLVRMQLAYLEPVTAGKSIKEINTSGDLVGQTIRDLRSMCRSFYPDVEILQDGGFADGIKSTLQALEFNDSNKFKVKGIEKEITPGLKLIIFKMVQEILVSAKEILAEHTSTIITFTDNSITLIISYIGNIIDTNKNSIDTLTGFNLTLHERIKLIDGKICIKKNKAGTTRIILNAPIKTSYE